MDRLCRGAAAVRSNAVHARCGHARQGAPAPRLPDGADGAPHGALAGAMASLKLRSAPATLVVSVVVLFSWLFSIFGMQASAAWVPGGFMNVARFAVLLLAPVLAPFNAEQEAIKLPLGA